MAIYKESELERYLVQVRRIAESREAGAERKIRKMYKELAEDLNSWLGNVYAKYAEDDRLDYNILRSKGQYARFLEEVQLKIDEIYPELKTEVENLIDTTYKVCWHGMYNGVTKSKRIEGLKKTFSASKSITPEQIKAAVQNPISKLRLNLVLNRNRQQIISNIRREIGVGLSNGDSMSTMARRIQRYVDNDRSKALLIARTEAHRVREVGFNDSAERIDKIMQDNKSEYRMVKTWRNVGDLAVRKTDKANHVDMEGQMVLADEEFTMVRSGAKAKCPGTSGIAAEDCNCRCRASRDIMNDAEFYALTGRHFPGYVALMSTRNNSNNTLQNKEKHGIIDSEKNIDYMSNSFRPKYGKEAVDKVGKIKIPVKRVTNSQFELYTDVENTTKNKAVRLTEKNMRKAVNTLPNGFEMPKIVVVDFDKYNLNTSAIGGYRKETNTMYINSKYDTTEKIKAYINKTEGYFANNTELAPYLHELGHKQYEDSLVKYAEKNNISVEKARYTVENKLSEYMSEKRKNDINYIINNLSIYANTGYTDHHYAEIFAECYSMDIKNTSAKEILDILKG